MRTRDTRTVKVQRRLRGSSTWRTIATRKTDAQGYWSWTHAAHQAPSYRFLAAGRDERDREAQVELRVAGLPRDSLIPSSAGAARRRCWA